MGRIDRAARPIPPLPPTQTTHPPTQPTRMPAYILHIYDLPSHPPNQPGRTHAYKPTYLCSLPTLPPTQPTCTNISIYPRRFVLKQINDKELAMFLDSAPAYFEHLSRVSVFENIGGVYVHALT